MKQIFIDLVNFVNQDLTPESLVDIEKEIGGRNLRVVAIKLLSWLKAMNNLKKVFPKRRDSNFQWQGDFFLILNKVEGLNNFFTVTDNRIYVADTVSKNELNEIWEYVDINYNPQLFTTYNRTRKLE